MLLIKKYHFDGTDYKRRLLSMLNYFALSWKIAIQNEENQGLFISYKMLFRENSQGVLQGYICRVIEVFMLCTTGMDQ